MSDIKRRKIQPRKLKTKKVQIPDDWMDKVDTPRVEHIKPKRSTVMWNRIKRTLSGKNKTGQVLAEIKNGILAVTPWRDLSHIPSRAIGLIETITDGTEHKLLNALPEAIRKAVRYVTTLLVVIAILWAILTGELAITDVLPELIEYLK